jgi:hypothetical protein
LASVSDGGMQAPNVLNPHFVDGTNQAVDYTYDAAGRLI